MASRQKSYHHAPRKQPLTGLTVGHKLYIETERNPDNEMYVFCVDKERKTFKQMLTESLNLAASFLSLGLQKGDKLAILGNNHSEHLLASYACMQIGVIVVHSRLQFASDKIHVMLKKTHCNALFLTRSPANLMHRVRQIIPDMGDIKEPQNFKSESLPNLRFIIAASSENIDNNNYNNVCYSMDYLLSQTTDSLRAQVKDICLSLDADDPCNIFFTSGSTGFPKCAVHSHHAILNGSWLMYRSGVDGFVRDWDIRFALTASFSEASSLYGMFLPLQYPRTVTVISGISTAFLATALQSERCTDVILFINQLSELVHLDNIESLDMSALKIMTITGSIVPKSLRSQGKRLAKYVTSLYGSTEMLGVGMSHPIDSQDILDSAAISTNGGTEVKIVDDQGDMVPVNTRGKICVRSATLLTEYYNDEQKTKESKDKNGWFHTGDLGIMDDKGFVNILGRNSDLIIMKDADNLAPMELEAVLYEHEAVEDALVVGIPDELSLEEVCACIKLRKTHTLSEDAVREYCKDKVNEALVPKYVLFVESFPTTDTGKFHRRHMAEKAATLLNRSPLPLT